MTLPADPPPLGHRPVQPTGFTLIELLVALAILGLALALAAGHATSGNRGLALRGAAAELAGGLRLARAEAILRNRPVAFALDPQSRRFRVADQPVRQLPTAFTIEMMTTAGERRRDGTGDIRFNPDGSSTGGRIAIADGPHRIWVGVDWLSGRVAVADAL
jgi:general secretion pathway protein H